MTRCGNAARPGAALQSNFSQGNNRQSSTSNPREEASAQALSVARRQADVDPVVRLRLARRPGGSESLSARDLTLALHGRWTNGKGIARCPAHPDRAPSLSIIDGDRGHPILYCFAGCDWRDARQELIRLGLWPHEGVRLQDAGEIARRRAARGLLEQEERHRQQALATELWDSASRLTVDDLGGRYLRHCGLLPPYPPTLRFGFYYSRSGRRWPALVAAVTRWPDRSLVAVQVTPLIEPGLKAWSRPARLTLGVAHGGAVRLAPWTPGQPIVLTEGVEDGLAVATMIPGATPWAMLGAGNARHVVLPEGADVILALDGDEAGRAAAKAAVPALWRRGHKVRVMPLPDGADPLDLLQARAG